jgi:hypothetical protein
MFFEDPSGNRHGYLMLDAPASATLPMLHGYGTWCGTGSSGVFGAINHTSPLGEPAYRRGHDPARRQAS